MALTASAYAAQSATTPLVPHTIERREPGKNDVAIEILYCGVCHSDIHQTRDQWERATFPMVPGHEIVGRVTHAGENVRALRAGDVVGVGCFVDSCRMCGPCKAGEEQFCERGTSFTYNSFERDGTTPTYGGYSTHITVDEAYVLRIPSNLDPAAAAPLLCAGITTYSPLRHYGVKPGDPVAILGLGGLGHMGVKIAKAMGAHVTVLSHSPSKREDALRLGADDFIATNDPAAFAEQAKRFSFILDTVSAEHDYNAYLELLRLDGALVLVGIPQEHAPLSAAALIGARRSVAGSNIGGIRETQEMLDFCADHGLTADIEVISIQDVNDAYERAIRSDVRYRFVIDIASLRRV